jgi:dephospho-CoA kinase
VPHVNGHTLLVGVTGGIGSGKTLVCRSFERARIAVLYADDIAKAYLPDGSLNRERVATLIFSRPALKKRMDRIVHPRVRRALRQTVKRLSSQGHRLVVIEAALIYESGMDEMLDYVIVVDAPREQRIRRVMRRDGVSRSSVERRMRAQWSTGRKRRLADVVVDNGGSPADLRRAMKLLVALFKRMSTP